MTVDHLDRPAPATGTDRRGAGAPAVSLRSVSKLYGRGPQAVLAVDRLSLDVAPGEFVCLVGASGCGKSTLLSMVSGLEPLSGGRVDIEGEHRPALMFQEAALLPWLTVRANVELALKLRGVPRKEREGEARQLLATVHLADFGDKRPHELSGGMRQRVALARTLAQHTPVLLMDEPFGALDAMTRDLLHDEIERIWRERQLTVLFVTHNVREAARLGDRIILLSSRPGRVVAEYPVDIPRPRRIDSPEIAQVSATVTDRLRAEVRRHGR
jgi:NitT/TauT family transport system ATP-binding protein